MNTGKNAGIIHWIKTHRFWTSVIVLWSLHLILYTTPLNLLNLGGVLEFALSSQILGYYTLIGGIIWSVQQKKNGLSLITLGIVSMLIAFNILGMFLIFHLAGLHPYYSPVNYIMMGFALTIGAVFIYFGSQRYKQWIQCRTESDER